MTNRHLMIVGLLALVAAVLVGLNWRTVVGTADRETEQVGAKAEQPAERPKEARSELRDGIQTRCEKFVAKRVADDVDEAEIEDACACATDEIYGEFVDELPDMMRASSMDPEFEARIDEIIEECAQQGGLEFQ